ncbi:MAG: adenylyltransferase/cytidyltransferase family protein [Myxococcota bacterium]
MKAPPPDAKIVSLAVARDRIQSGRARGQTWVLANGVFDLFHVGHLRYLTSAADEADHIIVAINSDRSTQANKGPDRPVIPEAERAEIVAGLGCVDLVLIFDALDVRAIIESLRPDVHAKGTDYTVETVPEGDFVRSYGGRVAICGDPKNHATSTLVSVVKNR